MGSAGMRAPEKGKSKNLATIAKGNRANERNRRASGAAGQSVVVGPSRRDARVERFDIEIGENDRRRGKSKRARMGGWQILSLGRASFCLFDEVGNRENMIIVTTDFIVQL